MFAYGPNDWGSAAWYKEKYPGFTGDQYRIFEMYYSGMTAKQHRNMLKKKLPQNNEIAKCF
jgi:hypothetical protein